MWITSHFTVGKSKYVLSNCAKCINRNFYVKKVLTKVKEVRKLKNS